MNRYQLAKIVAMTGELESRKRVQKTVYLLQVAGCNLGAEFRLHFYGPYSSEVAGLLDDLTRKNVLVEEDVPNSRGTQYNYHLAESANQFLTDYEATEVGTELKAEIERYGKLLMELLSTELWPLELASTIVAFKQAGNEWDGAVEETRQFKNVREGDSILTEARKLAERIVAPSHAEH